MAKTTHERVKPYFTHEIGAHRDTKIVRAQKHFVSNFGVSYWHEPYSLFFKTLELLSEHNGKASLNDLDIHLESFMVGCRMSEDEFKAALTRFTWIIKESGLFKLNYDEFYSDNLINRDIDAQVSNLQKQKAGKVKTLKDWQAQAKALERKDAAEAAKKYEAIKSLQADIEHVDEQIREKLQIKSTYGGGDLISPTTLLPQQQVDYQPPSTTLNPVHHLLKTSETIDVGLPSNPFIVSKAWFDITYNFRFKDEASVSNVPSWLSDVANDLYEEFEANPDQFETAKKYFKIYVPEYSMGTNVKRPDQVSFVHFKQYMQRKIRKDKEGEK